MKNSKYIVLGLLLSATLSVSARVFEQGERLYIEMEATDVKKAGGDLQYGWYSGGSGNNYNYAYFYKGSTGKWSSKVKQYQGTVWYVEAPKGDWEYVILTRHNSANPSWDTKVTQTGDIWFYYMDGSTKKMREQNFIKNFYYDNVKDSGKKDGAYWQYVAPSPSGDPSTWSYEDEQICTNAAGTPYMLQAKNYDYDNTYAHAWFKYENNKWTRIQGDEWRDDEGQKAYEVTLGGVNSDVYYFLQCSRPSMCRLIRVRINQDCSEGAPGACKITSFVAVASDANVTDKTSAVNGVVAFDDKKNAGQLMIWSPDVDTLLVDNADIETPQTFRLKGFDASAAKTYKLYAKFLSGDGCESSCTVKVTPPVISPTTHDNTGTPGDLNLVRFTEEDVTLTPDYTTSTYFRWTNSADEDTIVGGGTDPRAHTFTAPTEEQTIHYYFLATNDPPKAEGNLISNGTFETPDNLESKYDYWGQDLTDYYTTHKGASGGYALVKNSTTFYHTYNEVTAHEGSYFGLFDSKVTSNIEDQAAWIAKSGPKNPKLHVREGVSYLFSFWVANINAYYQMDNGARLQFQISYDGGSSWNDLGGEVNLGNYKDNRWHGLSSIATPTSSSENVALRVINKNTSDKNIGNDFALDDIRFEAVTASTSNISSYEHFPVTYLKCLINSATFAQQQPVGCGTAVADVNYTINFVNPRGDLYIYEESNLLAKIPHASLTSSTSHTGVLKNQPVDNAIHTLTVYFKDEHVQSPDPGAEYTYKAKAVPAINIKSMDWNPPQPCDLTTATLTAVLQYTNQNGTLSANVDGGSPVDSAYSIENDDLKEVTLVISGIPADGKTGHVLNVKFNGSHGCPDSYPIPTAAPYMPSVNVDAVEIQPYACGDATYSVKVTASFTNSQNHDLIFKDWKTGDEKHVTITENSGSASYTFTGYTWDDTPTPHEYNVYFVGAENCDHKKSYTSQVAPALTVTPIFIHSCDVTTYSLQLALDYTNQRGNTILANVDGAADQSKANKYKAQMTPAKDTIQIDGLIADGKAHVYNLRFDDANDCKELNVAFKAPYQPQISSVKTDVQPYQCGDGNYQVKVTVTYNNAQDSDLVITDEAGHSKTLKATDATYASPATCTFDMPWEDPIASHTFKAYFVGAESCKDNASHKDSYTSPAEPKFENVAHTIPTTVDCDATTFDFTVTFDYCNQDGTFNIDLDGTKPTTITPDVTTNTTTVQTVTATFKNIPADGTTGKTLTVGFTGGTHNCPNTAIVVDMPMSPVINSVMVTGVPTTVPCGTTAYDVTVKLEFPYDASGREIILTYDSLGTTKTTTPIALTKFPYTLTLYNLTAGSKDTVYAAFSTSPTCTTPGGYTLPEMTSCIRDTATVCDSKLPYWWPNGNGGDGMYCSGSVGENKIQSGTDSLWLFVIATPDMTFGTATITCDDADSIRIPISSIVGNPDLIDITIGAKTYEGKISGTDLAFARATELVAGDYSANVTFGTKGTTCTQTKSFRFTVALGGAVYSKWTDVLFVSNAGNQFVSYQWYENGIAMSGETQQRLYRPKGLPGSYYCQLVTTDGKTVYTCEQTFDQIQPSRSEGAKQTTVIRKYRVSPHVYIVQTETDGIIETKKILTPYE